MIQGSAGVSGTPAVLPEGDGLYEQVLGETEEAVNNKGQEKNLDCVNNSHYYDNDSLFPRTKQATAAGQTKKDDDLFPNSTTAQPAHSSHSDEGLASATSVVKTSSTRRNTIK